MTQPARAEKDKEVVKKDDSERALPILPVRDTVLFPHAVLPLTVGRESSVQLINSLGEDKTIVVVAQREARVDSVPEAIPPKSSEVEALQRNVLTLFQQIVAGSPTLSDELSTVAMNIE